MLPPPPPANQDLEQKKGVIQVDVELVLVPVTVVDARGRMVTGLESRHFRVFEDGVEQEVELVHVEDAPISTAIVFDVSGSMSSILDGARQAAYEFLRTAERDDAFVLVAFRDRAEVVSRANSTEQEIRDRLLNTTSKGSTAMLDGIYLALAQLRRAPTRRRAMLVITDGMENHSRYSERDVQEVLREADVAVYGIGYDGLGILQRFAASTGGRIFPLQGIHNTATLIWAELRNQYVLGYRPSNRKADGSWRKIKVELRAPRGLPNLYLFAKDGYYARRDASADEN